MRKKYIDILKGISILSIMLLHFEDGIFPVSVNVWIGSFMISAFYFVSGWLTAEKKEIGDIEFLRRKWRSLGIPYCWFSLIFLLFYIGLYVCGELDFRIILRDLYKTLTLRGIGTLWFLPALFFGELIFRYFLRFTGVGRLILVFGTLFYLGGYHYWSVHYGYRNEIFRLIDAPFRTIQNIAIAWYVIAGGYYCAKFYSGSIAFLKSCHKILIAFLLLGWYSVALFNDSFHSISALTCIVGPFGLLLLCMEMERFRICSLFSYFGRNSLIVMVTHYTILQELCVLLNRHWTGDDALHGKKALIFFAIALLLEVPLIQLINGKAKFLLGRS